MLLMLLMLLLVLSLSVRLSLSLRGRTGLVPALTHESNGRGKLMRLNLHRYAHPCGIIEVELGVGFCSTALGLQATGVAAALFKIDGHAMYSVLTSE